MSAASKGKILIIEDDKELRSIYADAIESSGYTVVTAEDGEQGLALAKREKPDLILLDIIMPKLPGFEVLKGIRANAETEDTIVIILSVIGEKGLIQKAMNMGANGYVVKGSSKPNEIVDKIQTFLTKQDIEKSTGIYRLFVHINRGDAAKLQSNIGWTKPFTCVFCSQEALLLLIPDTSHSEGHWFSAHFACPICGTIF
jgi:DNA-binding response OmpR family regulator